MVFGATSIGCEFCAFDVSSVGFSSVKPCLFLVCGRRFTFFNVGAIGRHVFFTVVGAVVATGFSCVGMRCCGLGLKQAGGGNRAVGEAVGTVEKITAVRL